MKSRPLRTREHIIADISVLHFQWIVAKCGHVAEEPKRDYGYDLALFTYTKAGEIENGSVLLQFKATDAFENYVLGDGETISYPTLIPSNGSILNFGVTNQCQQFSSFMM